MKRVIVEVSLPTEDYKTEGNTYEEARDAAGSDYAEAIKEGMMRLCDELLFEGPMGASYADASARSLLNMIDAWDIQGAEMAEVRLNLMTEKVVWAVIIHIPAQQAAALVGRLPSDMALEDAPSVMVYEE
jgi:hypothetical protein